jgi:energy-coupling factor transporter transmembrane protein EcfT
VVVLTAVDSFTHAVDITQIAGLLERVGLRGLGFSLGVALNLLPGLQQSGIHAWQSLRMRGGLRQKKWRGLRLLVVTIITNALRRAEEIALAAESRAFSPERSRPAPLKISHLDRVLLPVGVLCMLIIVLLP